MKNLVAASAVVAAVLIWPPAAHAQGWVPCATEGGFCYAPEGAVVYHGARGAFTHRRSPPGGLPCDNQVFGAPLVGVHKACFFSYW